MSQKRISGETRKQVELQFAELVGRLQACEHLEDTAEQIKDHRVLYGWNMLTQEVLIRLAEATLKLIYQLHFDRKPPRGHNLRELWDKIPKDVQHEIETERGQPLSFAEYHEGIFQDVRYSAERLQGGSSIRFEVRRLYLDSLASVSVAEGWLGGVKAWPWAGLLDESLAGYEITPIADGSFQVWIDDPIEPMDWAGAIIVSEEGAFVWTLYFGFTDKHGGKKSYELPSLAYPWPLEELYATSVAECVRAVHKAYQEPAPALLEALRQARLTKNLRKANPE